MANQHMHIRDPICPPVIESVPDCVEAADEPKRSTLLIGETTFSTFWSCIRSSSAGGSSNTMVTTIQNAAHTTAMIHIELVYPFPIHAIR